MIQGVMILYGTSRNSTDDQFSKFRSEINEITLKYMKQETSKNSKMHRITLISAPTNEVILMEKQGQWLLCPHCHGKARIWICKDTVLHNFLLFCPKCKREELIDLEHFQITLLKQSDAKTQN